MIAPLRPLTHGNTMLNEDRLIRIGRVLVAVTILSLAWMWFWTGTTVDPFGRPVGTDFSNVYAAGKLALDGQPAAAWDWATHYRVQQQVHADKGIPFYGWHYPPPFLFVAALLAPLDYVPALLLWQMAGLAAAFIAVRPLVRRRSHWWIVLGFPGVLICLGHGQNGLVTAALLGGGLVLLDRRPIAAGILFGLLTYKPQLGLLLPLLLLGGGHWRAIAAATVTAGVMALSTLLLWGPGVWEAFYQSIALTKSSVIENTGTGAEKIVTPFAAMRLWGASSQLAWLVQFAAIAGLALLIWRLRNARPPLRNAAMAVAALLATPYAFDYDMVVMGFALLWLLNDARERPLTAAERALFALAYIAPLIGRAIAGATGLPLNMIALVGILLIVAGRIDCLPRLTASPFRRSHAASGR